MRVYIFDENKKRIACVRGWKRAVRLVRKLQAKGYGTLEALKLPKINERPKPVENLGADIGGHYAIERFPDWEYFTNYGILHDPFRWEEEILYE